MAISQLEALYTPQLKVERDSSRQKAAPTIANTYNHLTSAPISLEVHMAPLAIIQPFVAGFDFKAAGAHVHHQIEKSVQQLYGEEVCTRLPVGQRALQTAVAEHQQAAGLCGAEVEGYGARLLCVPPGQCQVGRRCVKGDRLQGFHILAAEYQITMDTNLGIPLLSQA